MWYLLSLALIALIVYFGYRKAVLPPGLSLRYQDL